MILLYHDHGTCEQFHSEIKSDMDLERLPSEHFSTNSDIMTLALLSEDHTLEKIGSSEDILQDEDLLLKVNLIHEHMHYNGPATHKHRHSLFLSQAREVAVRAPSALRMGEGDT